MRLSEADSRYRLISAEFGVLGTVDRDRGVHVVPVVFAVSSDDLVIPIDSVKPKSRNRLRRIDNLLADGRASLLVDHISDDWTQLWWVRADLDFTALAGPTSEWPALLAAKYPQYGERSAIEGLLVFTMRSVTGWSAS